MPTLREMLDRMREFYLHREPMEWWPDDPMEVIIGAILVPGTTWKVVARILDELKTAKLLDFQRLLEIGQQELETLIRPAGFQPKKTRCIKEVLGHVQNVSAGNLDVFFSRDPELLRKELLSLYGVGEATADNILLYAGNLATYSIDPFTRRVAYRHALIAKTDKDRELRRLIDSQLADDDPDLFNDFQALIVRIGRDFCGKTIPKCSTCPLNVFLPEGGAIGESALKSRGCPKHELKPRCSSTDISGVTTRLPAAQETANTAREEPVDLNETERAVFDCLSRENTPIDTIIERSGLPTHKVLATLSGLEMRHLIRRSEGNTVRRC